jgi:NodT family efflux transporter outer membrane factor (OMF) lipoprotein
MGRYGADTLVCRAETHLGGTDRDEQGTGGTNQVRDRNRSVEEDPRLSFIASGGSHGLTGHLYYYPPCSLPAATISCPPAALVQKLTLNADCCELARSALWDMLQLVQASKGRSGPQGHEYRRIVFPRRAREQEDLLSTEDDGVSGMCPPSRQAKAMGKMATNSAERAFTAAAGKHSVRRFVTEGRGETSLDPAGRSACAALILLIALTGCTVGPKYTTPSAPAPPAFKESMPAAYSEAPPGTWQPAQPQDAVLKGKWWETFNEPELNQLEEQLDIDNQTIKQYFQNFMAARAQVRESRAAYYPTLTASPSFNRTRSEAGGSGGYVQTGATTTTGTTGNTGTAGVSQSSGNVTFNEFALPFDVAWEPDLWGRIRNTVREYQYAAQVSAADLENQRLTEQADLAVYYFELRGQDSLQDLYNRTIEADRKALELTKVLVETGIDSPESEAQADVTLQDAEAQAVGIATNRAIYEHAIATLIGKPASEFSMPVKALATPVPAIPVGVPSQLLQRRPDIAAAERTMAQANALIGVEKAAYYPTVSLTGSGGLESSLISKLFSAPALFWSIGSSASQLIFDAGLRKATVAQYTANYNADVAAYRQAVLTAFQQVEDYIASVRVASAQIEKQQSAVNAAKRYLEIAMSRYQTGLDPYLNVITAQTTLLSDQQTEVTLRVSEMTAAVQLIQALGGGWDKNQLPAPSSVTSEGAATKAAGTSR